MPRPTRVHVEGALCLVTCRAAEGTALFQRPQDYETYLQLLQEYRERYGFKLFAYTLLPDQVLLCVEPAAGTTVSTFMHALSSRYTKYLMKRHGRAGHVFQERFKLALLEKAPWLLRVTGYLHTHPRRSGLTRDFAEYRWCSCPSYLAAGASRPGLCLSGEVAEVLEALGRLRPGWTYALYLQSLSDAEWDALRLELERPAAGSPAFLALVEQTRKEAASIAKEVAAGTPEPSPATPLERGVRQSRRPPLVATAWVAMVTLSLSAAWLSARSADFLRQTLRVLSEENSHTLLALASRGMADSPAQLTRFQTPQQLGGTLWEIQLKPTVASQGETPVADKLRFDGDRLVSSRLREAGFPASRYLMKPAQAGTGSWETVQIGPGGEMVSWQGEWRGSAMHGVMTRQQPGGEVETFRFLGMSAQQPDGEETSEI